MAHVLVTTTPFGGHQPPLVGVAGELVRRGHRVTYYTGARYREVAQRCGARWLPWRSAQDFDDSDLAATFPDMATGDGLGAMFDSFRQLFFGTGPGQLRDLSRLDSADRVDVVVGETTCVGASFLHEARGVPWAGFSLSPIALSSRHTPPIGLPVLPGRGPLGRARDRALNAAVGATLGAAMRALLNEARRAAGLPQTALLAMDALCSPQLQLAQGVWGLEYARPDAPDHMSLVGDTAAGTRGAGHTPDWLAALDARRPIVHVTPGTLDDSGDVVTAAVEALRGTPAQVVVGGDPGRVPPAGNVVAPGWVPHDLLLPRTSVVVTNGGYGGVLAALAHGVPVVVVPGGQDKPEVARRVAWSGAGLDLRRRRPAPARVRAAVEACLGDSPYRRAAHGLADDFAAAGGAPRAADLIEQLLRRAPRG